MTSSSLSLPCGAFKSVVDSHDEESVFSGPSTISYDAASDTYSDTFGCVYRQLPQDYPFLSYFYTEFELHYNAVEMTRFAHKDFWLAFLIVSGYLTFVYVGTKLMSRFNARFSLYNEMIVWNSMLSIFSLMGFLRTAPHLINNLVHRGFFETVRYLRLPCRWWTVLRH